MGRRVHRLAEAMQVRPPFGCRLAHVLVDENNNGRANARGDRDGVRNWPSLEARRAPAFYMDADPGTGLYDYGAGVMVKHGLSNVFTAREFGIPHHVYGQNLRASAHLV